MSYLIYSAYICIIPAYWKEVMSMHIFYTVRRGDSIYMIASRWQIPPESLIFSNRLSNPDVITPGMQLSMPPGVTTYEVRPGDTLYRISQSYRIPLELILEANNISPPYTIKPGDIITVPQGVPYYTVRKGDTLFSIARRYNTDAALIARANSLDSPLIYPGMNLIIPYPPVEAFDGLAIIAYDDINFYLFIYNGKTGDTVNIPVPDGGPLARVFASPDSIHYIYVNEHGVIYLTNKETRELIALDQTYPTGLVAFSKNGDKIVYSNSRVIRMYDIKNGGFTAINRRGASYVQWLSDNTLIFEARDNLNSAIYTINTDGTDETLIFNFDNPMNDVSLSPTAENCFLHPRVPVSPKYIYLIFHQRRSQSFQAEGKPRTITQYGQRILRRSPMGKQYLNRENSTPGSR